MMLILSKPVQNRVCGALVFASVLLFLAVVLFNRSNDFKMEFKLGNQASCESLFLMEGFSMSQSYHLKNSAFNKAVQIASNGTQVEGYTGYANELYKLMHNLSGQSAVRSVCETGFNLGHSAFNYLTANDLSIVHSFDIGDHSYARPMADYLKEVFPKRFNIHFGDSTQTIPEFIRANPDFRCDVMFVDGGHVYPVALADIKNFAQIANLDRNLILFDDYPTDWGMEFGKAWEDMVKEGIVEEHMRCTYTWHPMLRYKYGLVIGRVLKRPQ